MLSGEGATAEVVALAGEYRIAAQLLVQNGRPSGQVRAPFRMVAIHAVELYLNILLDPVTARAVRDLRHSSARADLACSLG